MNENLLATAGDGNEIRIWNVEKRKCEHTIYSDKSGFLGMHFNTPYQRLITGNYNGTIRIWDMNISKLEDMDKITVKELKEAMTRRGIDYSDCLERAELFERAVSTNSLKKTDCRIILGQHTGAVLALDSIDNLMVSGGHDGHIRLWDIHTGSLKSQLAGHQASTNGLLFFQDRSRLASIGHDGLVAVHDFEKNTRLMALAGHVGWVWGLALDKNDQNVLVSSSIDRTVKIWDISTKKCVETICDHPAEVPSVQVDWQKHRMISSSFSGKTLVHDTRMWKPVMVLEGFTDRCTRMDYTRDMVFVGSMDGTVRGFNFAYNT